MLHQAKIARVISRRAMLRNEVPDFRPMATGIEEMLMPMFVAEWRRAGQRLRRDYLRGPEVKADDRNGYPQPDDERQRGSAWKLFATGTGLIAIALRNAAAKAVDWLNRQWIKWRGVKPPKALKETRPGDILTAPAIPAEVRAELQRTQWLNHPPPESPENPSPTEDPLRMQPTFKTDEVLGSLYDDLHNSSQLAAIQFAKQEKASGIEWQTEHDERVCSICSPLDGKRVNFGGVFTEVEQVPIMAPPAHRHCRCKVVPWWARIEDRPENAMPKLKMYGDQS